MSISDTQLKSIHAKAASLTELYGDMLIKGKIPDQLTMGQLWLWDNTLTNKSGSQLSARLALYKHQKQQIRDACETFKQQQEELTGWISRFRVILNGYTDGTASLTPAYAEGKNPIPFEELLFPFAEYAVETLRNICSVPSIVSDAAITGHVRYLLIKLSRVSAACFYEAFDTFRKAQKEWASESDQHGITVYQRFIEHCYAGGIIAFFEEYSSLARLLTMTAVQWVNGTALLCKRLSEDEVSFSEKFFQGETPGLLVQIEAGITAAHTDEGEVCMLTFASGDRLVYKPRSAATDLALHNILTWLNNAEAVLPMRSVTVQDRGRYSWHAYIPYQSCKSETEVSHYYQRIGQLAGLLHVLGSTDYHFGNLIAHRASPVLVDNETLLSPFMSVDSSFTITGDRYLDEGALHSLSRSLFLLDTRQLIYRRASSISGAFEDRDRQRTVVYHHVNQDAMVQRKTFVQWIGKNIPKIGRTRVDPFDYMQDIKSGYARVLQWLNVHKTEFGKVVKIATRDFTMDVRLLVRPTAYYLQLASFTLQSGNLRDGLTRSLVFEKLALFYMNSEATAEVSHLLWLEQMMMENQLIPWFNIGANDTRYRDGLAPARVASIIRYSAQGIFEKNMRRLSPEFAAAHAEMMDHYFTTQKHVFWQDHSPAMLENIIAVTNDLYASYRHLYPVEELVSAAANMQPDLLRRYTLGDGLGGILVVFAAMEQIQSTGEYHSAIRRFMDPLRIYLSSTGNDDLPADIGYGALDGLGSIVYSLCTLSQILQDNAYRDLALMIVARTALSAPDVIDDLSLAHGMSGYLVSLLKLDQLCQDNNLLPGIQLLSKMVTQGLSVQRNELEEGYMRGTTGVLFALCKLYQRLPDQELYQRISALYTHLDEHWSEKLNALSRAGTSPDTFSLDHGLAGWFMVQHAASKISGLHVDQAYLLGSASKLLNARRIDPDQISTGLAGRCVPALMMRAELSQELSRFTTEWSSRYQKLQRHNLNPQYLTPLFYEGTAGILYQQLRLLNMHVLPSIMAFE